MKTIAELSDEYIGHTFEHDNDIEARLREAFKSGALSQVNYFNEKMLRREEWLKEKMFY